ncbi:HNH endonuclease [Kerstersia gyiorum]|uniref:HNH endonuclease n=1 Tax=Kerstersia gyiorum TaxID=206506 RepID=UPI00215029F0|nr:HNH endonuclease [Kerstersia gyiorum]MCR4160420.1 HNH endonuclease [Kerstersia gyiorum]
MDCYLCCEPLTPQNNSAEHIIPNSIGGIRKIKGFICRTCNSKSGETWDIELAKQLNKLALFFCIVRDRGENPHEVLETSTGKKFIYAKNSLKLFAPLIKKDTREDSTHFQISANNMNQIRQIVTGLKRSHPTLDVEKALANATTQTKYPDEPFDFEFRFGGRIAGKSFVKTALALLSANGINPKICERANAYIFDDGEPCFGYYYHHDLLINRPVGMPIHCICVRGNNAARTIQAYLEYFGVLRIAISLSANYEGDDFKHSYAIDPTKGQEFTIDFDLGFDDSEIKNLYDYQFYDSQVVINAWHEVLRPEIKRQQEQHLNEILEKTKAAMEHRFSGSDHIDLDEFIAAYMDILTPYICHLVDTGRISDK